MAFEEITVEKTSGPAHTGVGAGLAKVRGAPAKLQITLRRQVVETMGFKTTDRFVVLLGTDEHHGLIRIRKDKNGHIRLKERNGARESIWWQFNLGHRGEFVDRSEKARPCQWEKIDLTTIEVVLPAWTDATRPKSRTSVSATPPAVAAQQRNWRVDAQEKMDAERRRQERERLEYTDAAKAFVEQLLKAPVAPFDPALRLTPAEKGLLSILMDRAGRVISKEALVTLLYAHQPDDPPDEKIIDVYVCKIRPKIEGRDCRIETVWGEGFRFVGDPALLTIAKAIA